MKSPKALYILIAVFCVFALIAGIYAQFVEGGTGHSKTNEQGNTVVAEKDRETIKAEFNSLFTNTVNLMGFDTTGIIKNNPNEEIVYVVEAKQSKNEYEVNVHIPVINIKSDVANSFNSITQAIFVNKANEVLQKTDLSTITFYDIDFVAFVNGDILSVVIKSTLKEGQSAQRVMVQTYNYNLATNQKVSLNELITQKALNKDDVNRKIKQVVQEADNESKVIASSGYNEIFTRDLSSTMYTVEGSGTFFLGNNQNLYIVYAYGNQNFTSEMDIVLFE